MEQMQTIPTVPLPPTEDQAVSEVVVQRDRMDRIVDHLKMDGEACVCVHNCCSVCSTNEVNALQ
jgi:hypothetical protein